MTQVKDITGKRFGKLIAIELHHFQNGARWKMLCDCGVSKIIALRNLFGGKTISCGCAKKDACSANGKRRKTHGLSKTRLYGIHRQMWNRCINDKCKDYKRYGARGIGVCEEWRDRESFIEWANKSGYKDHLTIERKDINKSYNSENCTWIEHRLQSKNTSHQYFITYKGKTHDLSDWARITGICLRTLIQRKNRNWSVERMLNEKPYLGKNQYFL